MPSVGIIGTRGYPSHYGGFETAVRHLAPYLAEAGWDVTVYGRPGSGDPGQHRDPRVESVTTRGVESRSLSTLSYGFTATLDALRRKPDAALVMNVANGYYLPMLAARGIPTLVNVDGIEWERDKWGSAAKRAFRTGAWLTAKYASSLIFDANAIGAYWKESFHRDGTFIPYGGIEPSAALDPEPGVTPGSYVLVVARFVPENTIREFLDAVPLIQHASEIVIVGSSGYGGDLDANVAALAARDARVKWLGHISDDRRIDSLWQHAGVYFHGHSVGGTNPALVQAMACGAPVVARDTPYNREVLGEGGVFVRPTAGAISQAITLQLANRSRDKVAIGRQRVVDLYNWPAVCSAYEKGLRNLLV